jgi:hypothetical protein
MLWRRDKRRFLSLANGDCYNLRAFVPMFERSDGERPVGLRQASSNLIR